MHVEFLFEVTKMNEACENTFTLESHNKSLFTVMYMLCTCILMQTIYSIFKLLFYTLIL
jgi:hypothetical protein